jgi:DNA segregation ATPase FtsK/SpoIIIE-like protein
MQMMSQQTQPSYWNLAGSTTATLLLWLLPIFSRMDARHQFVFNSLALGSAIYGATEAKRLEQAGKRRDLEKLIYNNTAEEWVELESERRKVALQQQYGVLLPVVEPASPELPAAEPEWQPTNPFALSNEAGRLVAALAEFNVEASHQGEIKAAAFIRHKLKPAAGVKVKRITELADDIQVKLGLPAAPAVMAGNGFVSVDIPRPDRQVLQFADYVQSQKRTVDDAVEMAIGVGIDGTLLNIDLSSPDFCHFLIGGTTGAGKSGLIRALLYSLMARYEPALFRYSMFSEKKSEYPDLNTPNPWQLAPTMTTPQEWMSHLVEMVVPEMEGRDNIFEAAGCKDISVYNEANRDTPLPHWVILCDGYAEAIDQLVGQGDKASVSQLETNLVRLAQRARSVGIHLILATQRPDGKLLNPRIRSNLPARICLNVRSEADSDICTGEKGLNGQRLLGKGDMLFVAAGQVQRLQSLFVGNEQIKQFAERWAGYEPETPIQAATAPKQTAPTIGNKPASGRDERFSAEYLEFINSPEWKAKRAQRIKLDTINGQIICQFCGKPCTNADPAEVDHFRYPPKGSSVQAFIDQPLEDLRTLHKSCHAIKTKRSRKS